jgi:hypothetical protein
MRTSGHASMKERSAGFSIGAILVIIIIQALYLKSLPGSLVRVYYTRDASDFNTPPDDDMTVAYDGYRFDYRTSLRLREEDEGEIKALLRGRNQADMQLLIDIATWVRAKMSFGKRGGSNDRKSTDTVQHATFDGENRGLCDRYANYFAAACQAGGIPARVIELNGHVVPEAFLREVGRWVMIDPTLGYYLKREGIALSVADIINSYKNGNVIDAVVFAAERGDDSIYRAADESTLRGIYLNGYTVVSNQQLGRGQILHFIATSFSLPIAKLQYVEGNTGKIGRKELILRSILAINLVVFLLLALLAAAKTFRRRRAR